MAATKLRPNIKPADGRTLDQLLAELILKDGSHLSAALRETLKWLIEETDGRRQWIAITGNPFGILPDSLMRRLKNLQRLGLIKIFGTKRGRAGGVELRVSDLDYRAGEADLDSRPLLEGERLRATIRISEEVPAAADEDAGDVQAELFSGGDLGAKQQQTGATAPATANPEINLAIRPDERGDLKNWQESWPIDLRDKIDAIAPGKFKLLFCGLRFIDSGESIRLNASTDHLGDLLMSVWANDFRSAVKSHCEKRITLYRKAAVASDRVAVEANAATNLAIRPDERRDSEPLIKSNSSSLITRTITSSIKNFFGVEPLGLEAWRIFQALPDWPFAWFALEGVWLLRTGAITRAQLDAAIASRNFPKSLKAAAGGHWLDAKSFRRRMVSIENFTWNEQLNLNRKGILASQSKPA
jgi:hypothetical protein